MARFLICSTIFIFLFVGCDDTFNPKGRYDDEMAVYSVLSTKSDIQYVRVYTTYNPNGYNPLENTADTPVLDAIVTMQESNTARQFPPGTLSFRFRDTTLQREDNDRYSSTIKAYVYSPMKIKPGRSYSLSVVSPKYGQATSLIAMPSPGSVSASTIDILDPWQSKGGSLSITVGLSPVAVGYQVKFFIDYDVFIKDVGWKAQRVEIPKTILSGTDLTDMRAEYPKLAKRVSTGNVSGTVASYPFIVFAKIIYFLRQMYHTDDIRFKQALLLLIQAESALYNYVSITNGFSDPKSIRLDLPEYTNIKGGVGVFGGFIEDSTKYDLPSNFGFGK